MLPLDRHVCFLVIADGDSLQGSGPHVRTRFLAHVRTRKKASPEHAFLVSRAHAQDALLVSRAHAHEFVATIPLSPVYFSI